ncbi:superoxide dismutase family protein [candidate division KSB1 bacterium]|nr:superoxide dismutase family protein [candidate division KSB1 bacterium]
MKKYIGIITVIILFASMSFVACPPPKSLTDMPVIKKAIVVLHPTEGDSAKGIVTFTKVEDGIKIVGDIENLTPGKHGFHIHTYGDCSALDATSAGGHFNPENKKHGAPTDEDRHVGDLGNLNADENGNAHYERIDDVIAFFGPHSIIGRAIIVHAGEDDLTSQPTGNAGARVACGVIGIAEEGEIVE